MIDIVEDPRHAIARRRMVDEQLRQRGIRDERVLSAMERVPRHQFIDERYWDDAYGDHPVAVGFGATVSQPYMVATMLEALRVTPSSRVLEIGAGTGYQAALLGELAHSVLTIERLPELGMRAAANLERLAIANVEVLVADGSVGHPARAPFDRIIVAAAAPQIPAALISQLSSDGILLIPVGVGDTQLLQRVQRSAEDTRVETLDACRFVPLIGEQGHQPR